MILHFTPDARAARRRRQCTEYVRDADIAQTLVLEFDKHGSPVTFEAANWLVCFVPGLRRQWWHGFVHCRHKHVFAMRPEPNGTWTLFEPWWRRLMTACLTAEQARKFLTWAAAGDVLLVRESIPGSGSQIFGWANCAVLVSFLLGRSYRTWTPHGFYRRLKRERGVHSIDVSMLVALGIDDLAMASQTIATRDWYDHQIFQQRPQFVQSGAERSHVSSLDATEVSPALGMQLIDRL
jgi:hypothetical protein